MLVAWLSARTPGRAAQADRGDPEWSARRRLAFAVALAASLAAGYLRYTAWDRACGGCASRLRGEWVRARGTVVDAPVLAGQSVRFKLSLREAAIDNLQPVEARGLVSVTVICRDGDDCPRIRYGDSVKIHGVGRKPKPATNPGGFDRAAWLATQGVRMEVMADAGAIEITARGAGNLFVRAAIWLRERLERAADDSLPPEQSALLKGIVLGSKSCLPEQVEEDFRHAGVYHILSVSGLHVGFVFGAVMALTRRLNVHKRNAAIAGLLILPAYALLTGLKPPVLRAAIMAVPVHLGPYVQRKADSPTSLALASVLVVAMWPGSLFDPGFHLSFGATCGLIALSPQVEAALAFLPPSVRGPLSMTVAAQAAIAPVVTRQFQEVSVASFVANPVIVPVVGYCTTLGSAAMLLGSVFPLAGLIANLPNRLMLRFVLWATSLMVKAPGSYFYVRPPSALESAAYYAALWSICRAYPPERLVDRRLRTRLTVILLSAMLSVTLIHAAGGHSSRLRIVFLDVGQGDAALVMCPGGETLLVDAGPPGRNGGASAGKSVIVPCLRWFGVGSLDRILLTHLHDDHYGGLPDVLEAVQYGIVLAPSGTSEAARNARASSAGTTAAAITDPAASALAAGTWRVEEVSRGYSWESGGVRFDVLHPDPAPDDAHEDLRESADGGENDRSVVLMITYGTVRVLFTGDAGFAVEESLVRRSGEGAAGWTVGRGGPAGLRANILKVAHHGSNLSSSPEFLAAVGAEVCVVSTGPNSHGLPDRRAMARLRTACPSVLRTDEHGAVIVTTDGRAISVRRTISEASLQ